MTLSDKYTWALQHIDTLWCTAWDDDDIYLPWHLETLATNIADTTKNGVPRKIGGKYRYAAHGNIIRGFGGRMWQMCVFEPDELKNVENPHIQFNGFKWDEYVIDQTKFPISFIYRWGTGQEHDSAKSIDKRDEHSRKYRERRNAVSLKEPFCPHWKRDYIEDARTYLRGNPDTPIATSKELLALIPEVP